MTKRTKRGVLAVGHVLTRRAPHARKHTINPGTLCCLGIGGWGVAYWRLPRKTS